MSPPFPPLAYHGPYPILHSIPPSLSPPHRHCPLSRRPYPIRPSLPPAPPPPPSLPPNDSALSYPPPHRPYPSSHRHYTILPFLPLTPPYPTLPPFYARDNNAPQRKGAYGAHGLSKKSDKIKADWKTATQYQLFHAVALATLPTFQKTAARTASGFLFSAGITLFSGSVYAYGERFARISPVRAFQRRKMSKTKRSLQHRPHATVGVALLGGGGGEGSTLQC